MKISIKILLILILILVIIPSEPSHAAGLATRLKGRILLQVESHGEGWYVNPDNEQRYYLGRPADAFQIMRELGLGISNKDFNSFRGYAPSRLSGKILIKVEDSGKAYYVNPVNLKMYYLGRPADAFQIMRELGLGVKNSDIEEIKIYSYIPTEKFIDQPKNYTVEDFIGTVVNIDCWDQSGSGFIWGNKIMTNKHVIDTDINNLSECILTVLDPKEEKYGQFSVNIKEYFRYNLYTDFALLDIIENENTIGALKYISQLKQNATKIDKCPTKMSVGSKAYTIGYPAYADQSTYGDKFSIIDRSPILSEGIISGYDYSSTQPRGKLPYYNYYISNDIDSGSSGGLALSEQNGNLCLLGMPTWLSVGNYEIQGIVQNINNILYIE